MPIAGLQVGPYTFERPHGPPSKDPINLAFVDMMDGMTRVQQILGSLGFRFPWGVGDQYFAEPSSTAPFRRPQDVNVATAVFGLLGRDHVRLYSLVALPHQPHIIVGAVHRERWPEYLPWLRRPCDAVESFDAPRHWLMKQLAGTFQVSTIPFGNSNPLLQCSGTWPKSDGLVLVVEEPRS